MSVFLPFFPQRNLQNPCLILSAVCRAIFGKRGIFRAFPAVGIRRPTAAAAPGILRPTGRRPLGLRPCYNGHSSGHPKIKIDLDQSLRAMLRAKISPCVDIPWHRDSDPWSLKTLDFGPGPATRPCAGVRPPGHEIRRPITGQRTRRATGTDPSRGPLPARIPRLCAMRFAGHKDHPFPRVNQTRQPNRNSSKKGCCSGCAVPLANSTARS